MFHHIVLLTFKAPITDEHCAVIVDTLMTYSGTLDGLVSYHCGRNLGLSANAADFGISAVFTDEKSWHAYDTADTHNKIRAEVFSPIVESRQVVQFLA